jgi:integrase
VVPRPPKADTEVPVMTAEQVEALLAVAADDEQWGPLVALIANTGLRISEALALTWKQVDLDERTLTVRRSKTAAGRRTIPLVDDAVAALLAQRSWQRRTRLMVGAGWRRTGLVFTTATGTAVDPHNARRAQRRLLVKAGLPTDRPFHTMRHSLATRLLRRGVPMPIVSAILGHASIRTTVDIYGHMQSAITADDLQAVMDAEKRAR